MLRIEHTEVVGWEAAIRGARNPKNSWGRSDSYWTHICDPQTLETAHFQFFVGDNDLRLLRNLANAGPDHGKYLRMIQVYCDITGPLYWYKELDTYRMGVEKNSCSTMHTLHEREITMDDFSTDRLTPGAADAMTEIVYELNYQREAYLETKNKSHWYSLIQLLPTSFNQRRTYMFSYAALRNIYHARKHHKLTEWHDFCRWVESLPYASELITNQEAITHDNAGIENYH